MMSPLSHKRESREEKGKEGQWSRGNSIDIFNFLSQIEGVSRQYFTDKFLVHII